MIATKNYIGDLNNDFNITPVILQKEFARFQIEKGKEYIPGVTKLVNNYFIVFTLPPYQMLPDRLKDCFAGA